MGDWVYTVRQREPKMEILGKISLSAPDESNRATGPGSGAHEPKAARHRTTLIARMRKLGISRETAEQSTGRSVTDAKARLGRFSVPA
jgi:hypothetical protein